MKFTILQVVPRVSFYRLVYKYRAERHAKGFSSWDQCVARLFYQLAQSKSLREISNGLAVTCGKLSHLGLCTAPSKSTLSYANAHRPRQLYQNTFVGTSPNALKTQIGTALIALLLLKYLQFRSKCNLPLGRLVALLRLNLFSFRMSLQDESYRNLWDWLATASRHSWLDDLFEIPPVLPNPQLEMAF